MIVKVICNTDKGEKVAEYRLKSNRLQPIITMLSKAHNDYLTELENRRSGTKYN